MNKNQQNAYYNEVLPYIKKEKQRFYSIRVGQVISVSLTDEILVDFPDNPYGPVVARVALSNDEILRLKKQLYNCQILLVFENGNPRFPIITGIIYNKLENLIAFDLENDKNLKDIIIDRKRLVFEAKEEIVVRCGKGSITVKRNGKIEIRGTNLISRSSGCNRIKGATVKIN